MFYGIASGISGIVILRRLGAAEPLTGSGFELFAIASAIIGGTSFLAVKERYLAL
jgi:D-allose transport system permease protein